MREEQEKKRRLLYCPVCQSDMINLFDLVDHVQIGSCGMTLQRLIAVGVLDEGDINTQNEG